MDNLKRVIFNVTRGSARESTKNRERAALIDVDLTRQVWYVVHTWRHLEQDWPFRHLHACSTSLIHGSSTRYPRRILVHGLHIITHVVIVALIAQLSCTIFSASLSRRPNGKRVCCNLKQDTWAQRISNRWVCQVWWSMTIKCHFMQQCNAVYPGLSSQQLLANSPATTSTIRTTLPSMHSSAQL